MNVDIFIEIPYGTNLKYEYDKEKNKMRLDRVLNCSMTYPGNYGYIPNTLASDNDELDALLICNYAIAPGTLVNSRVVGTLIMTDEKGLDEKIILVPTTEVDEFYKDIINLETVPEITKQKISHFFQNYKKMEKGKWANVGKFLGVMDSIKLIEKYTLN